MQRSFRRLAFLLLALAAVAHAAALAPAESARIDYLLGVVAALHDAQFIRNGSSYGSDKAVSHLRLKLRAAGTRVQTAEDFIRYCATASSMSGKPYEIRFRDGRTVAAADFLREKLAQFDATHVPIR